MMLIGLARSDPEVTRTHSSGTVLLRLGFHFLYPYEFDLVIVIAFLVHDAASVHRGLVISRLLQSPLLA
jgi:hypothetical protein